MPGEIARVQMLGFDRPLEFTQTSDALIAKVPDQKPNDIACSLRITPVSG